jgi:pyruvate/2-oxoglutarate dehydrogenase complex dihydrolipoamide dehydrogenase (E3) component
VNAGEQLRAERIFINVGGRARTPPMPGIDHVSYLTNSSMMEPFVTRAVKTPGAARYEG